MVSVCPMPQAHVKKLSFPFYFYQIVQFQLIQMASKEERHQLPQGLERVSLLRSHVLISKPPKRSGQEDWAWIGNRFAMVLLSSASTPLVPLTQWRRVQKPFTCACHNNSTKDIHANHAKSSAVSSRRALLLSTALLPALQAGMMIFMSRSKLIWPLQEPADLTLFSC